MQRCRSPKRGDDTPPDKEFAVPSFPPGQSGCANWYTDFIGLVVIILYGVGCAARRLRVTND